MIDAALTESTPMKIAIVSLDNLGDQILRTGWARTLREMYPDATVSVFCSPATVVFWRLNPLGFAVRPVALGLTIAEKFDLAINPRPGPDYYAAARRMETFARNGCRERLGFGPDSGCNIVAERIPDEPAWESPFRLLRELLVGNGVPMRFPEFWSTPEAETAAEATLGGQDVISLGIGASSSHKIWPLHRFVTVADAFPQHRIALIGDGADADLAAYFMKMVADPSRVYDFVGKTSVADVGSIIKRCKLHIGNDSAPVHIAAAVGVPVVVAHWLNSPDSVFRYDWSFDPMNVRHRVVRPASGWSCGAILKGASVHNVPVDRVIAAAEELLA